MTAAVYEATGDGIARSDLTGWLVVLVVLGVICAVGMAHSALLERAARRDLDALHRHEDARSALSRAARPPTKETR